MGVKRSDCRTQKKPKQARTAQESWKDEMRYQLTRIQEAGAAIRVGARRKVPAWTEPEIDQAVTAIENEAQLIRNAYAETPPTGLFQFSPVVRVERLDEAS